MEMATLFRRKRGPDSKGQQKFRLQVEETVPEAEETPAPKAKVRPERFSHLAFSGCDTAKAGKAKAKAKAKAVGSAGCPLDVAKANYGCQAKAKGKAKAAPKARMVRNARLHESKRLHWLCGEC